MEWGVCPYPLLPPILSLHERGESPLQSCLDRLEKAVQHSPQNQNENEKQHLKLAVPIKNFTELEKAHQWTCKDPQKEVFCPALTLTLILILLLILPLLGNGIVYA